MLATAHYGTEVRNDDGDVISSTSAAEHRARALRAFRDHEARRAAGHDDEESVEAAAGAILDAEAQCDLHTIADIARAWLDAQNRS